MCLFKEMKTLCKTTKYNKNKNKNAVSLIQINPLNFFIHYNSREAL